MISISLTCVPEAVFDERVGLEIVVDKLVGGRFGDSDFTEPLYSEAPDWEHDMIYKTKSFKQFHTGPQYNWPTSQSHTNV